MKKLFMTVFAASLIFLTGCEAGEVQRRIVVHALGIDPLEGGYEVSYQVFSGGASESGGPVDASESTVVTLLAQGDTLYETEESLRLQTGKEVFMGDVELIVISEELRDADLNEFLSYFLEADIYLGVNVVYCRGSAKELIAQKLDQGSATALLLKGVVENSIKRGRTCSSRIIEISNALNGENATAVIPVLTLEKEDSKDEDSTVSDVNLGVFGGLLITNGGCLGEVDENEMMGIRFLRADTSEAAIFVRSGEEMASVEIKSIKIKRDISLTNGAPFLKIKIEGIYEIKSAPTGFDEKEIVTGAQEEILALCSNAFDALQSSGGDFIELGKLLYKYEQEYAEKQNGDFSQAIQDLTVSAEAVLKKY